MSAPICVNCISGYLVPGEPKGRMETIATFQTYVASPSQGEADRSKAVVSFTDVFGIGLQNIKIVADMIADQTGFMVYVPDLFNGKPLGADAISMPSTTTEAKSVSLIGKLTTGLKMVTVVPWLARNWPSSKVASLEAFVKAVREEKGASRVGAVGYCYGGKFAVEFNGKGLVDATVACHPSFTNLASYSNLKAPILFNCAETDDIFPDSLREQVQQKLDGDANAPAHDFKVFENCVHGFCTRPNFGDEKSKRGFEEGTQRTADWFKSRL